MASVVVAASVGGASAVDAELNAVELRLSVDPQADNIATIKIVRREIRIMIIPPCSLVSNGGRTLERSRSCRLVFGLQSF
jgi:hypothetical protein